MRVNTVALAQEVHRIIRGHYKLVTSCIESAYLFQRTALNLGMDVRRTVARAQAFSPRLYEQLEAGKTIEECRELIGRPGYWSVAVGFPAKESDRFGASDRRRNRYVGHVVCTAEAGEHLMLIDPSADQMDRPQYGLRIGGPVCSVVPAATTQILLKDGDGVVIRYELFPTMGVPLPRTQAWLDRQAKTLAAELRGVEARSINKQVRAA